MDSTNSGMEVRHCTRLADKTAFVCKTRLKSITFKTKSDEREWRATTEVQLRMPKIAGLCELVEVLETEEMYYVVMEKVAGKDLFDHMVEKKLTHEEVREIIKQMLEALRVMHGAGRIHKDIK